MSYFSEVKLRGSSNFIANVDSSQHLRVVSEGQVDTNNTTSTPLLAGATFTGVAVEILDFASIMISVYSNVASATDGLVIEQSTDGTNWYYDDKFTVPAGVGKNFAIPPFCKYLRVKYTNGSTNQTTFELHTVFKRTLAKPSTHRIADSITSDDDAELVKSIITGQTPQGVFTNLQATRRGNFKVAVEEYGDTPSVDAFSRLRVSNPYTIFDSKQLHGKQALFWDEVLGGSASSTHSAPDARTRLAVTASASDFAIRQTKMRFNYQPGKSFLVLFTFYSSPEAGVTKRMGLFDGTGANNMTPNNGIFLSTDGDISWNIAKNGTTTETALQAAWNVDTLDGSGDAGNPSGLTLNLSAPQIGIIDFEWLGVGRVRVGFVINGLIVYTHYFRHSNDVNFSSVYMSTPNLPLRYDISTDGSGGGSVDHICTSVMAEGGREDNGVIRYASTAGTHVDANVENTIYAIVGIRLQSTQTDVAVKLQNIAMQLQTASHKGEWILKFNPTVAGTFTYNAQTESAVEIALGALANTVTGGYDIAGGFIESGGAPLGSSGSAERGLENALLLGAKINGTVDTIVLCFRPIGGSTNVDVEGSISWRELS